MTAWTILILDFNLGTWKVGTSPQKNLGIYQDALVVIDQKSNVIKFFQKRFAVQFAYLRGDGMVVCVWGVSSWHWNSYFSYIFCYH